MESPGMKIVPWDGYCPWGGCSPLGWILSPRMDVVPWDGYCPPGWILPPGTVQPLGSSACSKGAQTCHPLPCSEDQLVPGRGLSPWRTRNPRAIAPWMWVPNPGFPLPVRVPPRVASSAAVLWGSR